MNGLRGLGLLGMLICAATCEVAYGDMPAAIPVEGNPGYCYSHLDGKPPLVAPAPNAPVAASGVDTAATSKIIADVPSYTWCYGCANTAAAILFGYYDRHGYPNMYTGPSNGGVQPLYNEEAWPDSLASAIHGESPVAASHLGIEGRTTRGHVDDFWYEYGSPYDPCFDTTTPWTPHSPDDCTGDFMCTSRADKVNYDGDTRFFWSDMGSKVVDYVLNEPDARDGGHGMKLFVESRGYEVETVFNQLILPTPPGKHNYRGFTFDDYKAEIDAGRPVLLMAGPHVGVGYGYNTAGGKETCYIRTTWHCDKSNSHTMEWGGKWDGEDMWMVTVLQLKAPAPVQRPDAKIKAPGGSWVGDTTYTGGQTAYAPLMPGAEATFLIAITNRGNVADSFRITGGAATAGWTATYRGNGGSNITTQVTGTGWTSAQVPAGGTLEISVTVKALAAAAANAILNLGITATSVANATRKDTVTASTRKLSADLGPDGDVDMDDLEAFVTAFGAAAQGGQVDAKCDMNSDGKIDHNDAQVFTALWLGGN